MENWIFWILKEPPKLLVPDSCYTKKAGARLERALINFMLDLHINEHGYEELMSTLYGEPSKHDRHRPATEI